MMMLMIINKENLQKSVKKTTFWKILKNSYQIYICHILQK